MNPDSTWEPLPDDVAEWMGMDASHAAVVPITVHAINQHLAAGAA